MLDAFSFISRIIFSPLLPAPNKSNLVFIFEGVLIFILFRCRNFVLKIRTLALVPAIPTVVKRKSIRRTLLGATSLSRINPITAMANREATKEDFTTLIRSAILVNLHIPLYKLKNRNVEIFENNKMINTYFISIKYSAGITKSNRRA